VPHHIIVDNLRTDPWAVTAAIAALVAAVVAIFALNAETKALNLAGSQLTETQKATSQTQAALELGQQQLKAMQKAEVDRIRDLAPYVTAIMELDNQVRGWVMYISNKGALARHVFLTGFDPAGQPHRVEIPSLDRHETKMINEFFGAQVRYCRNIRIRAWDVLDNKYITEYRGLSDTLAFDIFRRPWLNQEVEDHPTHCSDEVSWEVESFERLPGGEPETVEEGFDVDAPV
jgi:hypothetical protein